MVTVSVVLVGAGERHGEDRWRARAWARHGATRTRPPVLAPVQRHSGDVSLVLLFVDLPAAHQLLAAGELRCSAPGCDGRLGPWGSARERSVRIADGTYRRVTPRRGRCRACGRTQVLASTATFPRRADCAQTVGKALLAALDGFSHRRIAEVVDRPHTTVRGWIRRAQLNADRVWSHALRWALTLDPSVEPFSSKPAQPLEAMVEAIGHAVAAWTRRLGPAAEPWHVAVLVTGALVLAPEHHGPTGHPFDST